MLFLTLQVVHFLGGATIIEEHLFEQNSPNVKKILFVRDTSSETFFVGPFFKQSDAIAKLNNYGEDSAADQEELFLTIINRNKGKMFSDFPELEVIRDIFEWFVTRLTISFPDSILTGYPYFTDSNLEEIAELLNALGTGISELKVVELPVEVVKSKIPNDLFDKIVADLEKANTRTRTDEDDCPRIMVRSYKGFYAFEIDTNNDVTITTIEFSHEKKNVYFDLNEESDGTARLLDLIETLFKISDNHVFVINEMDRCLHPAMTVKIIELFLKMAKKEILN